MFNATVKNVSFVIVLERLLKFKERIVECARVIFEKNGLKVLKKGLPMELNMKKIAEVQIPPSKY